EQGASFARPIHRVEHRFASSSGKFDGISSATWAVGPLISASLDEPIARTRHKCMHVTHAGALQRDLSVHRFWRIFV
ncbi:hypothetical protein, partial [Paraburkholderia sp. UCT2]|uniref:hypothetical protein n=1 Tax=Paraburkholderia sp. UCT2 TaxID=2615208 RepID=UPI001CA3ADB0